MSEVLSAAIYLTEKAGRLVRDIREKGFYFVFFSVFFFFLFVAEHLSYFVTMLA